MNKLRFLLLYLLASIRRYKKIMLMFSIGIVLAIVGIYYFGSRGSKVTISEGVVGTYTEEDLPPVVTSVLSKGLVGLDESGQAIPNLAESWEITDDARLYKFKLKNNIYWLDGSEVKASDLDFRIPDVEVKAIDDKTISFKLSDSFSPFPTLLTKPLLKKNTRMGIGPYRVDALEKSTIFLKKVILISEDPDYPNLVVRFYPNEHTAKQAIRSGEVQSLLGVGDIDELVKEKPFEKMTIPNYRRLVTIFYNTKDPILSDENFRLALSFAAPSIPGEIEAQSSIPKTSWAFNPGVKNYLDNPEQAKIYLNKVKNGKDSTITLTSTSSLQHIGERVVEEWNKNGIKAVLRVESGIPQSFQALLIAQDIPADPDQYSLWHSTQLQTNISKFAEKASARIDKDLEDARKQADLEKRKSLYFDFQKNLLDSAPAAFLYFPQNKIVYLTKIQVPLQKVLELQKSTY